MTKRKILVVDHSPQVLRELKRELKSAGFSVSTATSNKECLEEIAKEHPELVFVPLLHPNIHGIDILKKVRTLDTDSDVGIIITRGKPLMQDYSATVHFGIDFYLLGSCPPKQAVTLAKRFFKGNLKPAPFVDIMPPKGKEKPYLPSLEKRSSYLKFWGTRGSIPVSGLDYYRYGGNTACLEVQGEGNDDLIIIDAGTGIRALGNEVLKSKSKNIHLFIGHTHWDHIIGFPFFVPVYIPGYTIDIYAPKGFGKSIEEIFTGMLDHDYFPVRLDEMQATFRFHDLVDCEPIQIGDVEMSYYYVMHPGASLGFKIRSKNRTIGYVTDNEALVGYHGHPNDIHSNHSILGPYKGLIKFLKDCDMLVHEAQYVPEMYQQKVGWGHSSITNALILIKQTGVKEWVVTHHDPIDNDYALGEKLRLHQEIMKECHPKCRVHMAFDGLSLPL